VVQCVVSGVVSSEAKLVFRKKGGVYLFFYLFKYDFF